jgi:hypothetical protein
MKEFACDIEEIINQYDVLSTPIEEKVRTQMVKDKKKNSMIISKAIE